MAGRHKVVSVFISSTFRDMHAERNHLVRVVFPELRERLVPYRIELMDIDLRWGITRQQAEDDRILDVCLYWIDECRPFFVAVLGERYGWVPLSYPEAARQRFNSRYGRTQLDTGQSITALEIRFGAFLTDPSQRGRSFFYFRDPRALDGVPDDIKRAVYVETDPALVHKLAELKERIRRSDQPLLDGYPARWDPRVFDRRPGSHGGLVGLEEFGRRVRDDLWRAIQAEHDLRDELPAPAGNDERAWLADEADDQDAFMESRLRVYVGGESLQGNLFAYADSSDPIVCLVTGSSGSGKSAALARFVTTYRMQRPDVVVIPHFIGASPHSASLRDLLRRLCLTLNDPFGSGTDVPQEIAPLVTTFRNLLIQVPGDRRVLIVIDGLDQLEESNRARDLYWLPPNLLPHVRIVASCIVDPRSPAADGDPVARAFRHRPHRLFRVPDLDEDDRRTIIRDYPMLFAKTLDPSQVDLLLSKQATANPLYLRVALEELRGFGSFERVNDRIKALPRDGLAHAPVVQAGFSPEAMRKAGDPLTALFIQVIERLESEFDPEVVRSVLTLLTAARRGLSDRELLNLLEGAGVRIEASTSDLFPVLRQLRPYLLSRGGLLGFFHDNLSLAVRRYLLDSDSARAAHARLADYFDDQPSRSAGVAGKPTTGLASNEVVNVRKVDELPWQRFQAAQSDKLDQILSDFDFVMTKCEAGLFSQLLEDYRLARLLDRPDGRSELSAWAAFFEQRVPQLGQADQSWPANRVLLQLAVEHADASPVTRAAERWLEEGNCNWTWLKRQSRPANVTAQACLSGVAVGDSIVELAVDAAGARALVLTGRYVTMHNSVDRWNLVEVDLQALEIVHVEPMSSELHRRPRLRRPLVDLLGGPAAPLVDFDDGEAAFAPACRALAHVGYHIPELTRAWEPVALLDRGERLVTGTHDGIIRIWDRAALELEQETVPIPENPDARRALDEARRRRGSVRVGNHRASEVGELHRRLEGLAFDFWHNAADRATESSWDLMNQGLRHIAFRFLSPTRIVLFRMTDGQPLATWVSDVPLLEAEFDNVIWSPSHVVRAVRVGPGLAVETCTGTAILLTAMVRNGPLDLVALDASVAQQEESAG